MTIDRSLSLALLTPIVVGVLVAACSSSSPQAAQRSIPAPHSPVGGSASAISRNTPSTTSAAGGSSSVNPCSLLSQSEVEAATGRTLGPGNRIGALDDCQWSTSDFARSVELDVGAWSAIKAKSALLGQTLTAVSGIGDEALSLNAPGNAAQLFVRTGKTGFLLLVGGGQYIGSLPDLGMALEKVLATAVLRRL
jgi:hypothetical protein